MIVLDTNVVSELMRAEPEPKVAQSVRWLSDRNLAMTSVTVAEVLYGIRRLAMGRRRSELEARFRAFMNKGFRDELLLFDEAAADAYSRIMADRLRIGRPIDVLDAMIAGIALARGAAVATRDVDDFADCGVRVINPWAWSGATP